MNARRLGMAILSAVLLGLVACSGGDAVSADSEPLDKGAGAGPAVWKTDPCSDPNIKTSPGVKHTVQNGVDVFVGTDQADVIVGTSGRDIIWGNGGNDVICAGDGEDEVHGGDGDDYIDGGAGNDTLFGGAGNDLIHGRAGSDEIHGGDGDDILLGDILDDKLFGDDLLIGGHGTDEMHGGKGNDYLRGDTGNDSFFGDEGEDVASFVTAMPPGDGDHNHPQLGSGVDGVVVDFTDDCKNPNVPGSGGHDGCAYGDGKFEPLDSIEVVVGSPYNDHFISGGNQKFVGGFGDDQYDVPSKSQIVDDNGGGAAPGRVWVYVDDHPRDLGLVVMGTSGDDKVTIHPTQQHEIEVDAGAGTKLDTNHSCTQVNAAVVRCAIPHTLRWVAAYGGDGNDDITFQGNFPRDFTAHANGGEGDDTLTGDDEQDVFFTGVKGNDWLYGNGGDDALLSESEASFNEAKLGANPPPYVDGADHLFGGPGNDQLVSDYPCGGHEYSGGTGIDIAGFARSGALDIHAQLADDTGNPSIKTPFYAHAYNPGHCNISDGTWFHPDLEILEASSGDDVLYGNDQNNIIWGREGNDEIHGLGGDDHLFGLLGDDKLYGEGGKDVLEGGDGFDQIWAGGDGQRDVILCGQGGGRVMSSDANDEITGCKY